MQKGFETGLSEIKGLLAKNNPKSGTSLVEEAFYVSQKAHENQKRASGEPYFIHPLEVAKSLAHDGADETIIAAALMHDVIEDTALGRKEVLTHFGKEVYDLVEGVTKLDAIAFKSRQAHSSATIIKTIMAGSKDIRILVIKLYDKLHNLRTIRYLPEEKQKRIAADALTVYVPLSHKLGMHDMKYALEDLCFEVLKPKEFKEIKRMVNESRSAKKQEVRKAAKELERKFPEMDWRFEDKHKSYYSTYSKMLAQDKKIKEINDTLILKIIVKNAEDCYNAIGKVHTTFKPIPKKFKDMIAIPEYAIYQSLHTQVIGPGKKPLKIYVFSQAMNEIANKGVFALIRLSEKKKMTEYMKMFSFISAPEAMDSEELAGKLNLDFHNRAMIVFTENGEVVNLPIGTTALDFAFFHEEKKAINATKSEVNGKIVPLWTKLNAGDRVKMHYSFMSQLNYKWISYVNSDKARKNIERELGKKNINTTNKLVKIQVEYLDKPSIFARQAQIFAKSSLDLEIVRSTCKSDASTCITEYYVRTMDSAKLQKAIKGLRDMEETLDINVDYVV